jgi:cytochrome P450
VDNSLQFLIAAYETTSATICHILSALAINPDIQNKLIKEIDDYFKSNNNNETIEELRYLDLCMKETLRLWPAFSRIARVTVEDTYLEHIFLPKGTKVYLPTYSIHRDPENYENPEDFIPERFLPENKYKIKAGSYIPFADGPRNCIGKELAHKQIKLIIVGLLKKYRFIACDELKVKEKFLINLSIILFLFDYNIIQ